jgi:preprotein translocase subunit SecF
VVVFDKIKENVILPSNARKSYRQLANDAMNQTLMRSINTSLSTLLPVGSLLFVGSFLLGADTLRDLALALFVGIASGTYSSIFVATPLLSIMKEKEPRYAALASAKARLAGADAKPVAKPKAGPAADAVAKPKPKPAAKAAVITPEEVEDALDDQADDDQADDGAEGEETVKAPAATSRAGRPAARPGASAGTRVQPRRTNRSKRKKGRR